MRNMKAIFGRKEEVEPRWALVEGSLAALEEEVAVTVAVDAAAIALWKRERSSSSSGAVMAIRRGGSTRGANMNSMGREKRRARVGMRGEEGYEKRGIMENGISESEKVLGSSRFFKKWIHLLRKKERLFCGRTTERRYENGGME